MKSAIFVDGPNLFMALNLTLPGFRLDFSALEALLAGTCPVALKRIYLAEKPGERGAHRFARALQRAGWETRILRMTFRDGRATEKEVDVNLAVDLALLPYEARVDRVVLVSGDGDLAYPVRRLVASGLRVEVVQFLDVLSPRLAEAASEVRILNARELVPYQGRPAV